MTELGFLMDLFLEEELPKEIKTKIKERIKEVEAGFAAQSYVMSRPIVSGPHSQLPGLAAVSDPPPVQAVSPVAQAALQARAEAISKAGKTEPGRTSPRKF